MWSAFLKAWKSNTWRKNIDEEDGACSSDRGGNVREKEATADETEQKACIAKKRGEIPANI